MPPLDATIRAMTYIPDLATDNELGRHLAGLMGGRGHAVYDRGQFRRWDPTAPGWVRIPDDEVNRAAAAYEGKKYKVPERPLTERTIRLSANKVKGIVKQAAVELAQPGFFNEAAQGAAFRNTFARVDGNKVVYEPHSLDHRLYAEHVLPFDLLPLNTVFAAMPVFQRFVLDTWAGCGDRKERIVYLGNYLGAAMLRQTWKYKDNPIFVGVKDTGKSVMLSTVRIIFPPGTVTCVTLQAMGERFGLSPLLWAAINVVPELPAAALTASEKAKALVVGDEVMVEEKYKTPFPFRCTIGHLFAANEVPHVPDDALRERFVLLDFPNVVPAAKQDRLLPEKIAAEAQAIASWAVHWAAKGVIARGRFDRPPSSATLMRSWASDSDSVVSWAAESIVAGGPTDFLSTAKLHRRYVRWCDSRNERPVPRAEFGRRLTRAGFQGANRGARGYVVRSLTEAEAKAAKTWR
jgi:P4 family phage/plasmid primase-like protien